VSIGDKQRTLLVQMRGTTSTNDKKPSESAKRRVQGVSKLPPDKMTDYISKSTTSGNTGTKKKKGERERKMLSSFGNEPNAGLRKRVVEEWVVTSRVGGKTKQQPAWGKKAAAATRKNVTKEKERQALPGGFTEHATVGEGGCGQKTVGKRRGEGVVINNASIKVAQKKNIAKRKRGDEG